MGDEAAPQAAVAAAEEEVEVKVERTGLSGMAAIEAILASDDWFSTLAMEYPTLDALGRPQWLFTEDDVSKAHRKLARYCHPDKTAQMAENDAAKAEKAFEKLRHAKEGLRKEETRGPCVRAWCKDNIKESKGFADGGGGAGDAVEMTLGMKEKQERERTEKMAMRGEESKAFGDEVMREMEKKRKAAELIRLEKERRKEAAALDPDSDDSDEMEERKRKAPMVKKKEDSDSDEDDAKSKRRRNAGRGRGRGGKRAAM